MARPASLDVDPERERAELREYLGADYDERRLERWEEQLEEELADCGDEERFYRTSTGYLYNLTAFAMSRTKLPYLRELARRVRPGARLLDYGCGIGSDGLALLAAGYRVEFADFDNPSVAYLRWRLRRRGLEAPVHDLDGSVPDGFDAAYAWDVIEHVPDPFAFLAELERRSALVGVNLLESERGETALHHELPRGETALHHELPVDRLLRHAASRRIVSYRILHGRSHLVLYEPRRASALGSIAGRLRIVAGRAGRRARR